MGLKLNPDKTFILTKMENPPWQVNTLNGSYRVVESAKYLGLHMTTKNHNMQQKVLKGFIKTKLEKVLVICQPIRTRLTYRIEQVYVDSLFRYFMTPYVIAGYITPEDAVDVKIALSKKMMKVNNAVSKQAIERLLPQYPWC